MIKSKTWTLTPSHSLTLAPPNKRGECVICHLEKDIWLISETDLEYRKLCWSCSLDSIRKLETHNYQVKNKSQIIKEMREALLAEPQPELLECYE
ncbi:MAG: hypothetical protein MRERV_16c050 [Mycoplasmataceae bacterium RV_VA103A]|nr:MAG: hypothetical protein MRERV_16c050 [Mycoplasmataceae bacterium RV_VA103A]